MMRRFVGSTLALFLILIMGVGGTAAAASVTSGNGIRLSPIRYDLTLDPGKSQTVQFRVYNITKVTTSYEAVVTDFVSNNTNGTPQLVVNNKYDPHSLKQFVSPIANVSVKPNQEASVYVKISIPAHTAGGGYYGAIRFIAINPSTGKTVNISASVAGLVLVSVPGPGMKQSMELTGFSVGKDGQSSSLFYSGSGIEAIVKLYNTGNVQEEPFGKITVTNMSGDVIDRTTINSVNPPGNVLPSSSRVFTASLANIGSFGKYTVSGNFGYGTQGQLLSASATFYVIAPWIIVLAIVVIVLIVLAIIFMPRFFRAWYRRSIKKA